MDECEVMAFGRERAPTIATPTPAPSWCNRQVASLRASDKSKHRSIGTRSEFCRRDFIRFNPPTLRDYSAALPFGKEPRPGEDTAASAARLR